MFLPTVAPHCTLEALLGITEGLPPKEEGRMKRLRVLMLIAAISILLPAFGRLAVAEAEVTTTLLPTSSESIPADQDKLLRIKADENNQPELRGRLTFDLGVLPAGATIKKATVQLVASRGTEVQEVQVFLDGGNQPVGRWTSRVDKCCTFAASSDPLRQRVEEAFAGKKPLSLTLQSISTRSDWRYFSMAEYGGISSQKPRLIIEYILPTALLVREQERDSTKTRWKFSPHPSNVGVKPFFADLTVISNPAFYDDGIYLFAQPSSQKTMLYALYPGGSNRWDPIEIKVKPGSHALVSSAGRLYSVGEDRIVIYDLEKEGVAIKSVDLGDFKPALRPTLGPDGSLYAMPSGSGYISGFNPDPQELWRYPSDATKLTDASRITLSPDAGRYAYVLTKVGKETHPVRIDAATGSPVAYDLKVKTNEAHDLDLGFKGFHRPVAIKGPKEDYVFLAAYTEQNGLLVAHSGGDVIWWKEGPVSQPIVDRQENNVLAVQNGSFRVFDKFNGQEVCSSAEANLATTSNLVMDGDGIVYFWNNGTLLGYANDCKNTLTQKLDGLPKDLELLFAPDGTLYARTEQNHLYTIAPTQKEVNLEKANLQTDTIYSADFIKVAANLRVETATNVFLKAQDHISFSPGFTVMQGASLRCRIGL